MANPHPSNGFQPGYDARRHYRGTSPVPLLGDGRTLAEIAKEATLDAVNLLHAVVNDENERSEVRTRAASVLLTMGWGAAPKAVNLNVVADGARNQELSEADIVALAFRGAQPQGSGIIDVEVIPAQSLDGNRPASELRVVGEGGSNGNAGVRGWDVGDDDAFDLDEFMARA
jgi:hypothetical protein